MDYKVKLYKVDKYDKTDKFIKESYNKYTLDEAIKLLEFDESYHMRLEKDNDYIFFSKDFFIVL